MEGVFLRKKFHSFFFLSFLCGLACIAFSAFLNVSGSETATNAPFFLRIGAISCLVAIPPWLWNVGAFIHINEDSIKAKYHWFGKIDCKLSDVTFTVAQVNTLIIQLKDGRAYTIMGIENSYSLASTIRRNIAFDATGQPELLIEKLRNLNAAKKKGIIHVCSGVALMFINIFVTVFLTGGRDLHEFSKIDWTIFAIMGVIEIATIIATFYFAAKTGKNNVPIEKLKYYIQRTIIETHPLLPGNVIQVFADENYTARITLFGYPNEDSVYYTVQEFASDYTFFKTYESEVFENVEQLPDGFESLIDITEKTLH